VIDDFSYYIMHMGGTRIFDVGGSEGARPMAWEGGNRKSPL